MASAPVRLCFLTVGVSRGVTAVGPVKSLGLGPAPSSRLAANPGNEIRDTSVLFLLPYTPSTSTRTCLFPAHRHRLFAGRAPRRDATHRDWRSARFTTREDRFSGPPSHCGGLLCRPRTQRPTSDAPVATHSSIPARAFSRCTWSRFRVVRRDRFHPVAMTRRSFSRSRAPSFDKGCAALLPLSRAAIAHPVPRGFACESSSSGPELPLRTTRAGLAWCCAPRLPGIGLRVAHGSLRHTWRRSEGSRSISRAA